MIFSVENVAELPSEELTAIYNSMPNARKSRVDAIKTDIDRANSIVAWRLVRQGMEHFGIDVDDYDYALDDNGKPYLVGCPLHFSISHSGDMVAVSVCDTEVGIDVQKTVDDYARIAKKVCTPDEIAFIKNKYDFIKVWAHKEATVKCTGEGISAMTKYDFSKEYDPCFCYTTYHNDDFCIVECKKVSE